MNIKIKKNIVSLAVVSALGMSAAFVPTANAANQPTYGSAVVDGVSNEWNLKEDFFSKMCEDGSIDHNTGKCVDKDNLSNLYLRYDCSTNTMYTLVLMEGQFWPKKDKNNAWIKIDNNPVAGGDPIPSGSEFAWIAPNGTNNDIVGGYEASFPLTPNLYDIQAQINIKPGRISLTGQETNPLKLSVLCGVDGTTPPKISIDINTYPNNIKDSVPVISVGDQIIWSYLVKNDGNVPLTNITVTDNQGVTVSCPKNTLEPEEVMECTAIDTAKLGYYANVGEVIGNDANGGSVSDTDPSHYLGGEIGTPPDIDISLNRIFPGEFEWMYITEFSINLTNINNTDIENIKVINNAHGTIPCYSIDNGMYGISLNCFTSSYGIPSFSVIGYDSNNVWVINYNVVIDSSKHPYPNIKLDLFIQDEEGNDIKGKFLYEGDTILSLYRITNTGNVKVFTFINGSSNCINNYYDCAVALYPGQTTTFSEIGMVNKDGLHKSEGIGMGYYDDDVGGQIMLWNEDHSHYFGIPESVPPLCELTSSGTNADGKPFIEVTVSDNQTGLYNINITKNINSTITGTDFPLGTTDPVIVTATKINQNESSVVELKVTDRAGNVTVCDPVITLEIRDNGKPVTNTFTDIPEAGSKITVKNGESGIKDMEIYVNGDKYHLKDLKDNEKITIDVSASMVAGNNNTITLITKGKAGSSAIVVIAYM